jgi:hypothetical protein
MRYGKKNLEMSYFFLANDKKKQQLIKESQVHLYNKN